MTVEQRREIEQIARDMGVTLMHVARLGILEYLDRMKAKRKAEADARAAEREAKSQRRGLRGLVPLGERMGGLSELPPLASPLPTMPARSSRIDAIYEDYARRIIAAGDDDIEVRRLILVATNAVHKTAPLTCPSNDEIVRQIEAAVVRVRDEAPNEKTRSYDDLVGAVVDATKIRTHGDVEQGD